MTKVIRLTHERLTDLLDFNRATGVFRWRKRVSNRVHVGDRVGVFHKPSGGRYISIDNEKFMAHRLALFYEHKRWPEGDVRPIDGDYDHCWILNLKEVSRVELAHERSKNNTNTSGYLGVSPSKYGRFQASITWKYKQISLGSNFETAEEASAVYVAAEIALKAAKTRAEIDQIVHDVRLQRRQRAAWANLLAQNIPLGWPSFRAFCFGEYQRMLVQRKGVCAICERPESIALRRLLWLSQK